MELIPLLCHMGEASNKLSMPFDGNGRGASITWSVKRARSEKQNVP